MPARTKATGRSWHPWRWPCAVSRLSRPDEVDAQIALSLARIMRRSRREQDHGNCCARALANTFGVPCARTLSRVPKVFVGGLAWAGRQALPPFGFRFAGLFALACVARTPPAWTVRSFRSAAGQESRVNELQATRTNRDQYGKYWRLGGLYLLNSATLIGERGDLVVGRRHIGGITLEGPNSTKWLEASEFLRKYTTSYTQLKKNV
jgi:hypothetical protein